jgi:hypothetical protein
MIDNNEMKYMDKTMDSNSPLKFFIHFTQQSREKKKKKKKKTIGAMLLALVLTLLLLLALPYLCAVFLPSLSTRLPNFSHWVPFSAPLPACFSALRHPAILVITAHPDDEAMFFSAAVLRLRKTGARVDFLCLSEGNFDGLGGVRSAEMGAAAGRLVGAEKGVCRIAVLRALF